MQPAAPKPALSKLEASSASASCRLSFTGGQFTRLPQRNLAGPGSGPDSAPIAAAPRPRARLRDDRRATNHGAQTT
jgi:hypothetical protein